MKQIRSLVWWDGLYITFNGVGYTAGAWEPFGFSITATLVEDLIDFIDPPF